MSKDVFSKNRRGKGVQSSEVFFDFLRGLMVPTFIGKMYMNGVLEFRPICPSFYAPSPLFFFPFHHTLGAPEGLLGSG